MKPDEIAAYISLLLQNTHAAEAMLHLVMEPGRERDRVLRALFEAHGGGHVVSPRRSPAAPLSFELVLGLLSRAPGLAIEAPETLPPLGINIEALRRESLMRGGLFVIIHASPPDILDLGLEVDPRAQVRVQVGAAELRAATAADWSRGWLRIPRDGTRPGFVARDRALGERVRATTGALAREVEDGHT